MIMVSAIINLPEGSLNDFYNAERQEYEYECAELEVENKMESGEYTQENSEAISDMIGLSSKANDYFDKLFNEMYIKLDNNMPEDMPPECKVFLSKRKAQLIEEELNK